MVTEHAETRFSEKQLCVLASQVRTELLEDQSHCESESFKLGETSDDIKASFAPSTIVPSTASLEDAQTTSPGGLLLGFLHWRELSCLITLAVNQLYALAPDTCSRIQSYPKHAKLVPCVRGSGVGVSTPFLAPCVSLHVQQTGVDSRGGPSEPLRSGPGLPHAALCGPLLVQGGPGLSPPGLLWRC